MSEERTQLIPSAGSPPALPPEISADGKEIWDWAGNLASWSIRQQKIRDLRKGISELDPKCGSCIKWMTSSCPKEKNVNGYKQGPSMSGYVCKEFQEKGWYSDLREKREAELNFILENK